MKSTMAVLCTLFVGSTVLGAEKGKTVVCNVTVSGGNLRSEASLDPQEAVLEVQGADIETGSINLQITPSTKKRFNLELSTGVVPSFQMSTAIGRTDVTVSAETGLVLNSDFRSSISCSIKN